MRDSAGKSVKMERRKWSDDEVGCLIDLYESKSCLWDIFNKDYSKRDIKEKALNEISEEVNLSVDEVKQKWLSHRASTPNSFTMLEKAPFSSLRLIHSLVFPLL